MTDAQVRLIDALQAYKAGQLVGSQQARRADRLILDTFTMWWHRDAGRRQAANIAMEVVRRDAAYLQDEKLVARLQSAGVL